MRNHLVWSLGLYLLAAMGCSRGVAPLKPPHVDAEAAGAAAITMYDRDGSQSLDDQELASCPGILAAKQKYDTDQDGQVTAKEIAQRVRAWADSGTALTSFRCKVIWQGKPLEGGTVVFDPEPFLGDNIKPATGKMRGGIAEMSIAEEFFPPGIRSGGTQLGLYKVRIDHPRISIPNEYNDETELGVEVPPRGERDGIMLVFELPRNSA